MRPPCLGGRLADQYLGYRYAILLGAVFMAVGEFLILGGNEMFLLIGMGALIVGNGYFKANISTIVGKLYEDNDPQQGLRVYHLLHRHQRGRPAGHDGGGLRRARRTASTTASAWRACRHAVRAAHLLVGPRELFCRALDWRSARRDMEAKWGMKMYQLDHAWARSC